MAAGTVEVLFDRQLGLVEDLKAVAASHQLRVALGLGMRLAVNWLRLHGTHRRISARIFGRDREMLEVGIKIPPCRHRGGLCLPGGISHARKSRRRCRDRHRIVHNRAGVGDAVTVSSILLVEDDEVVRFALERILQSRTDDLVVVENGADALGFPSGGSV